MNNMRLSNAFWIEWEYKPAFWVVKKEDDSEPQDYPVDVVDIDGNVIGNAANKTEYMNIWNANEANVAEKGYLIGEHYPFVFELRKRLPGGVLTDVDDDVVVWTIGGLKPLVTFRVGDVGKMQEGDSTFTHAGLKNKKVLVLANGMGIPVDYEDGEVEYSEDERHIHKLIADDHLDFIGGIVNKEIISIYAV